MDDRIYATDAEKLAVATAEALKGQAEGGIPIGAALFDEEGRLLGRVLLRQQTGEDAGERVAAAAGGHTGVASAVEIGCAAGHGDKRAVSFEHDDDAELFGCLSGAAEAGEIVG